MLSNPIQSTLRYAAVMHYHKLGVLLVLAGPSHRRTGQSLLPPTNGEAMAESRSILPTSSKRFSAAACSSPSQSDGGTCGRRWAREGWVGGVGREREGWWGRGHATVR